MPLSFRRMAFLLLFHDDSAPSLHFVYRYCPTSISQRLGAVQCKRGGGGGQNHPQLGFSVSLLVAE